MSEFESVEEELKFMADISDDRDDSESSMMYMRYLGHIRTLAAQRDEGLAREAELRAEIYETAVIAQRITSALPIHRSPALRNNPRKYNLKDAQADARVVLDRLAVLADSLASPGCADGEGS